MEWVEFWVWGGLPSKDSEGHRKYKSLSSNARAECMESGVIGVSISRLSDRKPSVLRIKLCEAKNPPHRTSQWSNEAWSEWESWGSWSLWGLALRSFFIVCVKKWWSSQRWGMKLRGWARHWRCWLSCGWPRCNRRWTYFLRLPHFYLRWCLNPISLSLSLSFYVSLGACFPSLTLGYLEMLCWAWDISRQIQVGSVGLIQVGVYGD